MHFIHPYIRAGILLHLVTLIEAILLFMLYEKINGWWLFNYPLLKMVIFIVFFSIPLFPQFDAYSRYQNYKELVDLFYFNGFDRRLVKPFIKSRCQRDAVMAAAVDLGYERKCRIYFQKKGYRWYHFFPDILFSNPRYLCCTRFWSTTFFTKKYISKVNKKMVRQFRVQNLSSLLAA